MTNLILFIYIRYKGSKRLHEILIIYDLLTQNPFIQGNLWFFYVQSEAYLEVEVRTTVFEVVTNMTAVIKVILNAWLGIEA